MQIDDRLGTFGEVTVAAGGLGPVLDALRGRVDARHPDAVETASRREGTVTWRYPGGKMTAGYAYARAFRAHVNLGFFQGVHLPDPEGLLEGTGKAPSHVKLRTPEAALAPAVRALMIAARDERRAALDLN